MWYSMIKIDNRIKCFLMFLFVFAATSKITVSSIIDSDVWWHMQIGRDLVHNLLVFWPDYYWSEVTSAYSNLRFTAFGDIILYVIHCIGGTTGLIAFRCVCVALCCLFLYLVSDRKITAFKIFLLIMLIVATYQKQLIRNSIFALILFPLVLYLFENKRYILILIVVSIWSFIHGSYLLGFGINVVMFISAPGKNKKLLIPLLVLFFVISLWNPTTRNFYSFEKLKQVVSAKSLNQTIFQPGKIKSMDFEDPFKVDRLYIKFVFALAFIALCLIRPKMRYIAPLFAISILGLGYIRFTSYLAIISVFLMFKAERENNLRKFDDIIFLIPLVMISYFTFVHSDKIRYKLSKFGFNKSETKYSDKNMKECFLRYGDQRTFTTMANGGYVLFKHWYPYKKVYIDTFWQPHTNKVQEDYIKYINNPDLIQSDCKSALIGFNNYNIIQRFRNSKTWFAESIDQGSVIFARTKPLAINILFTQDEIDKMSKTHETILGNVLFDFGLANFNN